MNTGKLRAVTLHAPPLTPVRVRLPDGTLAELGTPELLHQPVHDEKITHWPHELILTLRPEIES